MHVCMNNSDIKMIFRGPEWNRNGIDQRKERNIFREQKQKRYEILNPKPEIKIPVNSVIILFSMHTSW